MATIHRSATVDATPEEVWAYLADPAHWAQWDPDITEVATTEVGIVENRTWRLTVRPGLQATMVFDDVEPHRSFEWDIRTLGGLIQSEAEFRLEPGAEHGTTVLTYEFELEGPIGKVIGAARRATVETAVEAGLANIAAALRPTV